MLDPQAVEDNERNRLNDNPKHIGPQTPIAGDLTAFQRDCLIAIASYRPHEWPETRRPFSESGMPHGLAILEMLESYRPEEIQHGRMYPNLDTLVEKGLIEKHEIDRRTNGYTVTRKGRKFLYERRDAYGRALDAAERAEEGV